MISFIKNYSLENIKYKFLVLYLLNVTDIIFTLLLLSTGFYMEANTLMLKALENPLLSFLSKIVLPAILFTFLYFRMQKATDQQLSQSNFFISGAIILYTVVNISHLVWFAILPIFVFIL